LKLEAQVEQIEKETVVLLRGVGGDVWVGVGSILELGARARVEFFIFCSSRIGYAPYHSKKRKKQLAQNRVRGW